MEKQPKVPLFAKFFKPIYHNISLRVLYHGGVKLVALPARACHVRWPLPFTILPSSFSFAQKPESGFILHSRCARMPLQAQLWCLCCLVMNMRVVSRCMPAKAPLHFCFSGLQQPLQNGHSQAPYLLP